MSAVGESHCATGDVLDGDGVWELKPITVQLWS